MTRARIAFPVVTLFLALALGIAIRAFSRPHVEAHALEPAPPASAERRSTPTLVAVAQPAGAAVQAVDEAEPKPTVLIPQYHPRPPGEWQGMPVDVANPQFCERTEQCGLALSCRDSKCLPCRTGADCLSGEDCVLDHCLRRELIKCKRHADCGRKEEACILSGYSSGARTNDTTRAYCVDTTSGQPQTEDEWKARQPKTEPEPANAPPRPPTTEDDLLQRVR